MGEVHHRQPCRASRADIEATLTDAERELRRIEKERLNLDEMLMKGQTTERRHAQLNAGLDEDEQLHAARSNEAAAALAAIQAESTFFDAAQEMFVRMRKGGTATQAPLERHTLDPVNSAAGLNLFVKDASQWKPSP